jgi:hypothetical protein
MDFGRFSLERTSMPPQNQTRGENSMKNHTVKLKSFRGVIERVVVEDQGNIISVCTAEDLAVAQAEGREPLVVGFKKSDLVKNT